MIIYDKDVCCDKGITFSISDKLFYAIVAYWLEAYYLCPLYKTVVSIGRMLLNN